MVHGISIIDPQDISTNHLYAGAGLTHWSVKSAINDPRNSGTASVWNFGRPANVAAFIDENQKLWGPAFEKNMGGRVSWGVGQKLNNSIFGILFKSVADAIKFMNGEFSTTREIQKSCLQLE